MTEYAPVSIRARLPKLAQSGHTPDLFGVRCAAGGGGLRLRATPRRDGLIRLPSTAASAFTSSVDRHARLSGIAARTASQRAAAVNPTGAFQLNRQRPRSPHSPRQGPKLDASQRAPGSRRNPDRLLEVAARYVIAAEAVHSSRRKAPVSQALPLRTRTGVPRWADQALAFNQRQFFGSAGIALFVKVLPAVGDKWSIIATGLRR